MSIVLAILIGAAVGLAIGLSAAWLTRRGLQSQLDKQATQIRTESDAIQRAIQPKEKR
jgi:NhaP-type Na+/H+ or K+/H+ antiporter